jgi:septum formation protein
MAAVGWPFIKDVSDVDEAERQGENPEAYVRRLAEEKARSVADRRPGELVLGADTTVVVDGSIVGKPLDLDDARRMLRLLSGRWHEVLTGVSVVLDDKMISGLQSTSVRFNEMSEHEIEFLATLGAPLDKAGAYAVQAQAALFIEGIEGDYWNVVGLPINLVYRLVCEITRD